MRVKTQLVAVLAAESPYKLFTHVHTFIHTLCEECC